MEVQEALKLLERPMYYRHYGDERIFKTWSLGPVIENRDSDLVSKANSKTIVERLGKKFPPSDEEGSSWEISQCNHDAVGWVNHLSFQVFVDDEKTQVHPVVDFIMDMLKQIEDYPILDEELLSEMTMEYQWDVFGQECKSYLNKKDLEVTEEVISSMYSYCMKNDLVTIEENHWDISDKALKEAYRDYLARNFEKVD